MVYPVSLCRAPATPDLFEVTQRAAHMVDPDVDEDIVFGCAFEYRNNFDSFFAQH
jgi:hypothetical protein